MDRADTRDRAQVRYKVWLKAAVERNDPEIRHLFFNSKHIGDHEHALDQAKLELRYLEGGHRIRRIPARFFGRQTLSRPS